jgi:hypothetical protein
MEITTLILLLLVPLLVWRIYSRLKTLMGRNPSQLWRHYAYGLLPLLLVGLLAARLVDTPIALLALVAGAAAGAALAFRGFKRSRLENTLQGFFYTQDLRTGVVISMLFIGRLMHRAFELYLQMHDHIPLPPEMFHQMPLTTGLFGLLAAYYGAYHLLLARWRRTQKPVAALKQFDLPPL